MPLKPCNNSMDANIQQMNQLQNSSCAQSCDKSTDSYTQFFQKFSELMKAQSPIVNANYESWLSETGFQFSMLNPEANSAEFIHTMFHKLCENIDSVYKKINPQMFCQRICLNDIPTDFTTLASISRLIPRGPENFMKLFLAYAKGMNDPQFVRSVSYPEDAEFLSSSSSSSSSQILTPTSTSRPTRNWSRNTALGCCGGCTIVGLTVVVLAGVACVKVVGVAAKALSAIAEGLYARY